MGLTVNLLDVAASHSMQTANGNESVFGTSEDTDIPHAWVFLNEKSQPSILNFKVDN